MKTMTHRIATKLVMGLALSLIIGSAGCVNQPREVALYRTVLDRGMPATRPVAPSQKLSLAEALTQANMYYEELSKSGETYVQSLIQRDRAGWSFFPTANASGLYSWQNQPVRGSSQYSSSVSAGSSVNLFRGFQDVASLNAAGLTAQQQEQVLLDLRESIFLNIGTIYYQVLSSERSREVLLRTIGSQEEQLRDSIARRNQGIGTELTVAQNRAQVASTRASLRQVEQQIREGRSMLAYLIGQKDLTSPVEDELATPPAVGATDQLYAKAMEHRQDFRASALGVQSARQDVRSAVGQYYPSVSINVEKLLASNPDNLGSDLTSVLSLNLPIFSAGQIEASVRTAWSRYRQRALEEARIKRLVWKDIDVAVGKLESNERRLLDLQASVDASHEALRLAEASQRLGNASNLDRLTAEVNVLQAELEFTREQIDQKINLLSLWRSQGILAEAVKAGQVH